MLLLEICVSPGEHEAVNVVPEIAENPSQSISGHGCRPTRTWVLARLREHFPHAYMTRTQPWHEEFPLEWDFETRPDRLTRAVFVASRQPLDSPDLSERILEHQTRH